MSGNLFQTAAAALHDDDEDVTNCPGEDWVQAKNRTSNALANETVVHTYTKHTNQAAVTRTVTLAEGYGVHRRPRGMARGKQHPCCP